MPNMAENKDKKSTKNSKIIKKTEKNKQKKKKKKAIKLMAFKNQAFFDFKLMLDNFSHT